MSTTTMSYNTILDDVNLDELRRKEELARKALRKRTGEAQNAIAFQESRYTQQVQKLDKFRCELPDLIYVPPRLPTPPSGQDPNALEAYCSVLSNINDVFEKEVQQAVRAAQIILERRRQLAAAWQQIHAAQDEINVRNQSCEVFANQFGRKFTRISSGTLPSAAPLEEALAFRDAINIQLDSLRIEHAALEKLNNTWTEINATNTRINNIKTYCANAAEKLNQVVNIEVPVAPNKTATLHEIEQYLMNLKSILNNLQSRQIQLRQQMESRGRARELSGTDVAAITANESLEAWGAKRKSEARLSALRTLDKALAAAELKIEELPVALQLQVTIAIDQALICDSSRQMADLINRHRVRIDALRKAEKMLAEPPQYADDRTGEMSARWQILTSRLQAVIFGHDHYSDSLEKEYCQIQRDYVNAMKSAYSRANFYEAAVDSGFNITEGENDLVLMDLESYPDYRVEAKQHVTEQGYAVIAQLKVDPSVGGDHDAEVTELVCQKMQAMASTSDKKINSGFKVHERKETVTRAKRPAQRKAMAIPIDPTN